jgi:lipopolysaccharide/colanic/teichoic acid biosynthesis glycosyltransferase
MDRVEERGATARPHQVDAVALQRSVSSRRVYARVKRVADLILVLLASPAALLSIGFCALLIALLTGRPIFFVQNRVGRNGRIFGMIKLRTMQPHSAEESIATAKNDPRITSLGKFLRRSHLDELPQLWNVVLGEMSLIGPRPEQPQLVARYAEAIPNYELRHLVTPGLSGWAQVCYGYAADEQETRDKLEHDLYYVLHFGPALDLKILIRTIAVYGNPKYVR